MNNEIESIGIGMETGDIERGIKALDTLASQGPKVEQSLKAVETTVAKTGKSISTLGAGPSDGAGGLAKVAKTSKEAADGVDKLGASTGKSAAAVSNMGRNSDATAKALASVGTALRSNASSQEAMAASIASFSKAESAYVAKLSEEAKALRATLTERDKYIAQTAGMLAASKEIAAAVGAKIDAYKSEQAEIRNLSSASKDAGDSMLAITRTGIAAFFGSQVVQGARAAAAAIFEASAAGERLRTMLNFATGGNSAREIEYLREVTGRLGLEFASTSRAYGQFQAAARGTALEGAKARDIFESIARASAVMGLSADQTSGVLLALQQMVSKGTVQAEELRGQLGEKLPGAFQIAAKAMGVTTAELGKMLEQGQVVADDFLPKFARAMNENIGGAAESAAQRLDAAVNRFDNAWERLKQSVGDAGVAQETASFTKAATNDLVAMTEAIDGARASGKGLFLQLSAGAGSAIGRSVFDAIQDSANLLNGTLNTLTGGLTTFSTNVDFMPEVFKTSATRAQALAVELASAEQQFAALQARSAATSDSFYLRNEYAQLGKYIERLKEAKREQDKLSGAGAADPRDQSGFTGRSQSYANEAKRLEAVQAAMQKVLVGVSGVKESFQKDLNALYAGYQNGLIKLADYQAAVAKLINESGGGKANAAAIKESNKSLDEQLKLLSELSGVSSSYQEDLTKLQKVRAAGLVSEERYVELVKELISKQPSSISLTREQAEATKLMAKAYADVEKAYAQQVEQLERSAQQAAGQVQRLEDEEKAAAIAAASNISLAQAIEQVAIARLREALAAAKEDGAQEKITAIEKEIKAREKLITLMGDKAARDGARKSAEDAAREWQRAAERIEQSITDSLMRGFESGKGFAESLRDTVVNMFKTMVLRPVISAVVNPIAGALTGSLMAGSASAATGGMLAGAGGLAAVGSLFGAGGLGGALGAGAGWVGGATSLGGALGAAGSLVATGTSGGIMSGLAMGAGALAPIALGIGALMSIVKSLDNSGTIHTGASSAFSAATGLSVGSGLYGVGSKAGAYSTETEALTTQLAQSIVGILDTTATTFGKQAGYSAAAAFADDSSKDGAWGALAIKLGDQLVEGFGAQGNGKWPGMSFADGQAGTAQYLQAVSSDVRAALNNIGLPDWAQTMLDKLGQAPSIEQLGQVVTQINATQAALKQLGNVLPQLGNLSGDAVQGLLTAFGGVEKLAQSASSYYDNFYTAAEKSQRTTQQLQAAFGDLNLTLPATREGFRALVEAQDLSTQSGRDTYAALLQLSPAFASVVAETVALTEAADGSAAAMAEAARRMAEAGQRVLADLARDSQSLAVDLLRAQGNPAGALALEREQILARTIEGLSATDAAAAAAALAYNNALRDQITALEQAAEAQRAEQERIAAIASQRYGLEGQLLQLQGDTAAIRARERALLDESNRALYDRITALQDAQAAEQAAAQAAAQAAQEAQAIAAQRYGLEGQILQALGDTAAIRARELAALDPSNRSLQERVYQLQDEAAAQAEATRALEVFQGKLSGLGDTQFDLESQLLGLQGRSAEVAARQRERDLAGLTAGMTPEQIAQITAAYDLNAALRQQIEQTEAAQRAAEELAAAQSRAAEDAARAAEQVRDSWRQAAGSIIDEVKRIRGLLGQDAGQSLAGAQSAFAIASAQARAGDQEAAKALPGLSQTMLQLAEAQATSLLELQRIRAQAAASLEQTASVLGTAYGFNLPKLATGTNYVPRDMVAMLHQGEAVVPAAFNPAAGGQGAGSAEMVSELKALREDNRSQALALVKLQAELNRIVKRWDGEGIPEERSTTA